MRIGSLGLPELLIILLVVLLIFGPRRLPDMAKGLGQSVREFRKGIKDMKEDFEAEADDPGSQSAPGKKPAAQASTAEASAAPQSAPASGATAAAPSQAPATPEAEEAPRSEPEKKEA